MMIFKLLRSLWIASLALVIGACANAPEAMEATTPMIDFNTLKRPTKPNTYLVAPDGLLENSQADAAAPNYDKSATELFTQLIDIVKSEPAWSALAMDEDNLSLRFVATVPVFGFKDDVDIVVLPSGEGSTLAIYSRSRVGYSDFGVNRKRVQKILAAL